MAEAIRIRKVYNLSTGNRLMCCWTDCEKDGTTLHQVRVWEGQQPIIYIFCSERHRMLFAHSHVDMGNLPPGYRFVL
jgi:hypothetical protein